MPWQETSPMDLRSQFVREFASGSFTMTELAEAYRIAPKTGYKWVNRHAKGGVLALADRSRRPHGCPHATPANVTQALVQGRHQHPTWGAPKLVAWLRRRDPATVWPASSTACALLQQAGLVRHTPGSPSPGRAGVAAEYPRRTQRSLDGRLQRRVSHRGCRLVLSVDGARRPQSLCVAHRRVDRADLPRDATPVHPGVCGVWVAAGDPQ